MTWKEKEKPDNALWETSLSKADLKRRGWTTKAIENHQGRAVQRGTFTKYLLDDVIKAEELAALKEQRQPHKLPKK